MNNKASRMARLVGFFHWDTDSKLSNLHCFSHVITPLFILCDLAADQIMIHVLDRARNGACFSVADRPEVNFTQANALRGRATHKHFLSNIQLVS